MPIFNNDGTVTLSQDAYDDMCEELAIYDALRCAGVDNWSGWDHAMEMLGND